MASDHDAIGKDGGEHLEHLAVENSNVSSIRTAKSCGPGTLLMPSPRRKLTALRPEAKIPEHP